MAQVRYFILYSSKKLCHYDGLEGGVPVGDRGLVLLDSIKSVEKVVGVDTFVMKGENKARCARDTPEMRPREVSRSRRIESSPPPARAGVHVQAAAERRAGDAHVDFGHLAAAQRVMTCRDIRRDLGRAAAGGRLRSSSETLAEADLPFTQPRLRRAVTYQS